MADVNVETVIDAIIKLRDARSALKAAYDDKDNVLKEKMEKLNTYLLGVMNKEGSTQLGASCGIAYKQIRFKSSCSDWPTTWDFIRETNRFDFLEKRLSTKAIQTYHEETGEFPPGVNVHSEMEVIVRRK